MSKRWMVGLGMGLGLLSMQAQAELVDTLGELTGYHIVERKQIKGWVDADGSQDSAFKGCKKGRTILFEDGQSLTCSSYGYLYAYRPQAVILSRELKLDDQTLHSEYKMVVGDELFSMQR